VPHEGRLTQSSWKVFLAQAFQNPSSIIYNGWGSDTLWAGFESGREVWPAQCVWLLRWEKQ